MTLCELDVVANAYRFAKAPVAVKVEADVPPFLSRTPVVIVALAFVHAALLNVLLYVSRLFGLYVSLPVLSNMVESDGPL